MISVLLTYDEVMTILGVRSKGTLYNLVNRGVIPVTRIPGLGPRVPEDRLRELIEKHTNASPEG